MSEAKVRTAVVTGGTRGIGKEVVRQFVSAGYKVAVISASGAFVADATSYKCNVADFREVKETADKIIADLGGIDVFVNNAGITRDALALMMKEQDFDEVIAVNLKGAFNCCKHFMRALLKSPAGRIINVTSVAGICGNVGQANYSAAKAGLIGMTKSLAKELGGKGVTVNAVAPGFIDTDMTAGLSDEIKAQVTQRAVIKRFGTAADVAAAVAFLAGVEAGYITGQVLVVDGGLTL